MSTKNTDEEIVVKKVVVEDYSSDEDNDDGDFEYREKVSQWLEKMHQKDNIEAEAMEAYRDTWFYYNINRPHISVWIKWYEVCYLKKTEYSENNVRRDLASIEKKMKK